MFKVIVLLYNNYRNFIVNVLCSFGNTSEEIIKFVKEDQGFEPWNATNVNSFQDYRHQPLGQSSVISPQRTSKSSRLTLR
jgi:hypothetical protein